MIHRSRHLAFALVLFALLNGVEAQAVDATQLVRKAVEQWRGNSAYTEMEMTIHRADWQRSMALRAWSRGTEDSLVRVTQPAKDAGNATLILGDDMWSFSPKINRIIKIPSSMMGQAWMGSDLSNRDVSRADDIVDQYSHRLLQQSEREGGTVYLIVATPHEDAPVVWGREELLIRDDAVLLEHRFFDQDGELVKRMETLAIETFDGRQIASRQRMHRLDDAARWTELRVVQARFDIDVPDRMFTRSNLRNPRE